MKLFSAIYEWTLKWAEHKFAPRILALLTFCESVFFPIPPDVLLAPMVLAKPEKAWRLASFFNSWWHGGVFIRLFDV